MIEPTSVIVAGMLRSMPPVPITTPCPSEIRISTPSSGVTVDSEPRLSRLVPSPNCETTISATSAARTTPSMFEPVRRARRPRASGRGEGSAPARWTSRRGPGGRSGMRETVTSSAPLILARDLDHCGVW